MENHNFNQEKFERVKCQMDILKDIINNKLGILSIIAALAAALLVVATFNNQLLEITFFVKCLLIVLLLLIPLSLWAQLIDLTMAEKDSRKIMGEIIGIDVEEIIKNNRKEKGILGRITLHVISWMPWGILSILTIVILMIAFLMAGRF